MRPITANQKHIPTHQLTTITILVILDTLVLLDMEVHTKLQPIAMDLTLHPLHTHTPQVHHLILMPDIQIPMADIPTHTVDHILEEQLPAAIMVEAAIAPPLHIHKAIMENKSWTTLNQLLSTKSMLDKEIRSSLTRKQIQFNFQTEVFWRELELNLWIISSMHLLVELTLLQTMLENVLMNAAKENGNKNAAHPLLCSEKAIN